MAAAYTIPPVPAIDVEGSQDGPWRKTRRSPASKLAGDVVVNNKVYIENTGI
ncbi:hypothetical protein P0O24_07015 [Methanotrichaceae archaeon M04Ac]|uniref:Uncharacterized protein n=1 Tax=Candidatus Methanocrinis alkalitolerans TaxID=3033395 RepID=A0ABT5XF38_9EURY|nr:hypothetical protein [Candidatus Methanocrinis alkalitolerans]MCR3884687.1 hypothetical protein [Methanothrix sp.]MDF0593329.1 hypothetical protein [Candidatus Methanocrinis alkalitolerans]